MSSGHQHFSTTGARWTSEDPMRWSESTVTWSFATANHRSDDVSFNSFIREDAYKNAVRSAFDAWQNVANIRFTESADGDRVDIRLGFADLDGPYNTLARADYRYFLSGEMIEAFVRFDTSEDWRVSSAPSTSGVSFYVTALHEIGHALGLGHSSVTESVMAARLDRDVRGLTPDDIAGIQSLYGEPEPAPDLVPTEVGNEPALPDDDPDADTTVVVPEPRYGTSAGETLAGTAGDDVIFAMGGNDTVRWSAGADLIDGGNGVDTLVFADMREVYEVHADGGVVHVDALGSPDASELSHVERLEFRDGMLAFDVGAGETAGSVFRVYQAGFDRRPDAEGLAFWIDAVDDGLSLQSVAAGFVGSPEFAASFGSDVSNRDYVGRLYENILGRGGEAEGLGFWTDALDAQQAGRADVLANFAESPENVSLVAPAVADGIWFA